MHKKTIRVTKKRVLGRMAGVDPVCCLLLGIQHINSLSVTPFQSQRENERPGNRNNNMKLQSKFEAKI